MPIFLQLVSTRNRAALRGWGDPDWPGWIPVLNYSWGVNRFLTGTSSAGRDPYSGGQASGKRQWQPLHLSAAVDQLDSATLLRWAADGENADGKLNVVPDKPGKSGYGYLLTAAVVSDARLGGQPSNSGAATVSFTLWPDDVEQRYLLRFR